VPSVASHVSASINQQRDARASASANDRDRGSSSPFEEMLDSAVAADDATPPANGAPSAKAAKADAAKDVTKTKSANDNSTAGDAAPSQAGDLDHEEEATAERNEATLADLVGKALTDAGDAASPKPTEAIEAAAPAEKPIAEIGLAAFLEAVASDTQPKPDAEDTEDQPPKAEAEQKADADTAPGVAAGPVKADAVAAAVATMAGEVVADPVQPDAAASGSGAKAIPAAGGAPTLPLSDAPAVQPAAGSLNNDETLPVDVEASGADAVAEPIELPKLQGQAHKDRPEATAQDGETPQLQPTTAGPVKAEPAATKPEAPAPHPAPVSNVRAETTEAKPVKAAATPADAPAPTRPVEAPPTLQTLSQITLPAVGTMQGPVLQKDAGPVAAAVPIEGVAVEIAARASEGMHSFEIRLDPPELGRIHVRLDVDRNGELTSRVVADRQDTLDLLRRDAPQLERALNDAGLRTSNNGLQFSLRDHGHHHNQQQQVLPDAARLIVPDEHLAAELTQRGYYRPAGSAGGIDIRV
jgi:flagellar hook-length control protein FliK